MNQEKERENNKSTWPSVVEKVLKEYFGLFFAVVIALAFYFYASMQNNTNQVNMEVVTNLLKSAEEQIASFNQLSSTQYTTFENILEQTQRLIEEREKLEQFKKIYADLLSNAFELIPEESYLNMLQVDIGHNQELYHLIRDIFKMLDPREEYKIINELPVRLLVVWAWTDFLMWRGNSFKKETKKEKLCYDNMLKKVNCISQIHPYCGEIFSLRAMISWKENDLDSAIQHYRKAIVYNNKMAYAFNNLAWIIYIRKTSKNEDLKEARIYAQNACKLGKKRFERMGGKFKFHEILDTLIKIDTQLFKHYQN
ncbi:hypothetical protein GF373_11130, partial [bacterium]|nr:hypothetical protein [bacterium]